MARLSIEIPEHLRAKAEARAAESGHASVEQYVQALVRSDLEGAVEDEDFGAPDGLTVRSRGDLEAKLLEGLDSPASEMTGADWDAIRRKITERRGQ